MVSTTAATTTANTGMTVVGLITREVFVLTSTWAACRIPAMAHATQLIRIFVTKVVMTLQLDLFHLAMVSIFDKDHGVAMFNKNHRIAKTEPERRK